MSTWKRFGETLFVVEQTLMASFCWQATCCLCCMHVVWRSSERWWMYEVQDFHYKEKRCLKWALFTSCTNVRLRTEKRSCEIGGRKHVSVLHTVFNKDADLFITLADVWISLACKRFRSLFVLWRGTGRWLEANCLFYSPNSRNRKTCQC